MFLSECGVPLCDVHDYHFDLVLQEAQTPEETKRAYLCRNNLQYKANKLTLAYLGSYLASQQPALLKDMVMKNTFVVGLPEAPDLDYFFNTTQFDRITQFVLVPLRGSITYEYKNAEATQIKLETGKAYAVNNRFFRKIVDYTPDFMAVGSMWIEHYLYYYLKDSDGKTVVYRQPEEKFARRR